MSDLASNKINGELFAYPDRVFYGETMPVASAVTSDTFMVGGTLNALEIVGAAATDVTVLSDISYIYSENSDMSSPTTIALPFSAAAVGAGEEIFRYAPDHTKPVYAQIKVTGGAAATGTFNVQIASVSK